MDEGTTADQQDATDAGHSSGSVAHVAFQASAGRSADAVVSFDRRELREIFDVYGRRVAQGERKDYAIDFTPSKAVFSIYRRASEVPLYRVVKDPALARRQGAYSVVTATGLILKRGPDLARVLRVLEARPRLVVV